MATTELTGAEEVAWDLGDLYESADDPRIESDIAEAEADAAAFRERYHGKVGELGATALADAVAEHERIESAVVRPLTYAHLNFATNMADPARGALVARLGEKAAALDTQLLFFALEWAAVPDEAADALLADEALDHWRHHLRSLRKFRPYLLTEPEEKVVTEKTVSGVSAWSRLYEEQLGALRVSLDGDEVSLETAMARLYEPDRDVRRTASDAITEALGPGLRTRTFVFNTILLDKSIDDRLRGYADLDLVAQPRERDHGRGCRGARRGDDVALRRRPALLPPQGAPARARPARPLRPLRPVGSDGEKTSWDEARGSSSTRTRTSRTRPARSSRASSTTAGSTGRCDPTSGRAPSARRPCRASTRTSS